MAACAANSTATSCGPVRMTIASTKPSRFRATSAMDSRTPQPTLPDVSWIADPPSWIMPASNVTRVRSDGRSKSMARVRRTKGGREWQRPTTNSALRSVAVAKTRRTSAGVKSAALMRSRPRRLPGGATEGGLLSGTASRPRSALRVLRRLAGSLEAVLLALLHPRVAGEEAGLAKGQAAFRIELEESTGEAVPDRAGLTRDPATLDLDDRVELALGSGDPERQADICLVDRVSEVLDERASVHDDLTLARQEPDASDRGLASAGAGVEGRGCHG